MLTCTEPGPASQPIDRDVPTDKNEKKSRHASVGAPCMPARRRHAEQVGTEDTRFGEDVSRTCSTLAAPVVMPPAMWAIAARPLVPLRRTYVVTAYYGTESRPRHFRQKKRRKIRGPSCRIPMEICQRVCADFFVLFLTTRDHGAAAALSLRQTDVCVG